jgi:hypothetical protein
MRLEKLKASGDEQEALRRLREDNASLERELREEKERMKDHHGLKEIVASEIDSWFGTDQERHEPQLTQESLFTDGNRGSKIDYEAFSSKAYSQKRRYL